jgi:hypothetical protein
VKRGGGGGEHVVCDATAGCVKLVFGAKSFKKITPRGALIHIKGRTHYITTRDEKTLILKFLLKRARNLRAGVRTARAEYSNSALNLHHDMSWGINPLL